MKPLYVNKKLDEKRSIEMTTSSSTTNDIHDFLQKNITGEMHFNPLFGDESIAHIIMITQLNVLRLVTKQNYIPI